MNRLLYIIAVIGLLLSGCQSASEIPLPANNFTVVETSTNNLPSTVTEVPTTSTPAAPKASNSALASSSFTPTTTPMDFEWNICEGARKPDYETDLSPSGNWLAVNCQDKSGFSSTKIFRLDGTLSWTVPFYDAYGRPFDMKTGDMKVIRWTRDENFVYLVPHFCCADEPGNIFFNFFQNTLALYRLDLRNGNLVTTLSPVGDVFSGYYATISPSGKYLAYVVSNDVRDLNVCNLQTGETFTITVDEHYIASGLFSWSPDSTKAVFMAVKSGWDEGFPTDGGVSYFLLDLKTKASLHLFDKPNIYRINWMQNEIFILHNVSGEDGLLYNIQSNTYSLVTPTPTP